MAHYPARTCVSVTVASWRNTTAPRPSRCSRRARLGPYLVPGRGGVLIGFREASSHSLADIRNCLILDERVGPLLPALRALLSSLSCPDRIPQVEVACGDEGVALIVRHLVPRIPQDIDHLRTFSRGHG